MRNFLFALILSASSATAQAATITYLWTGTITSVDIDNGTGIYTGTEVGDTFSGTFTYDPNEGNIIGLDTSDGDSVIEPSDVWVEYFLGSGSSSIFDGTTRLNANNATLSITDDYDGNIDAWGLDAAVGNSEFIVEYASLLGTMYDSLAFRPTPPWSPPGSPGDPVNESAAFQVVEYDNLTNFNEIFLATGSITSAAVVPLPAAAWLFGSALGLLGWMRRRKSA